MHFSAKHPSASFEEQTMAALFSNITIPIVGRNHPHQYRFPCPFTAAEYSGDIPRNFLEALVPESPQARDEAMRLHHARSTSAFDLLQAIGFDATGALRLSADPHLPIDDDSLIPISDSQIANRLRAAAPTGIQSASVDEHWSVAGQQGKIALRNRNGSWFSTTGIARTTHIIKPGIPTLPHQAFNEHITHAHCGGDGNTRGPHLFSHL